MISLKYMKSQTLEPFSPPSWSLSLSPQTNTLVLMVAADSKPDDFFRARLTGREVTPLCEVCRHHKEIRSGLALDSRHSRAVKLYLPVAVFSSSSSSLSDAKKGTVAKSSSSARMRPTMLNPWILQSIPELRHCLIAISMYL